MEMRGKVAGYVLSWIFVLSLLFLWTPPSAAQNGTVEDYVNSGENALFSETIDAILEAHAIFLEAKRFYPDDPVVNAYLALTRLLHLGLTEEPGSVTELLAQFGITRTGYDLETLEFQPLEDSDENVILPESAPSEETIRSFFSGPFLTALNDSIANLDSALATWQGPSWTDPRKHVISAATLESDIGVEFDEGDVYLFRGGLKFMKTFILLFSAYNLDVDLREIVALGNMDALDANALLTRYPELLNLLTAGGSPSYDGTAALADARTALIGGVDDYLAASSLILADADTAPNAEELVSLDECDLRREAFIRENLVALRNSLTDPQNPVFSLVEQEETWTFTEGTTTDQLEVHFWDNMSEG
jgi:hypothetical protein